MSFSADQAPEGTIRSWVDARAEENPTGQAFLFVEGAPSLTWAELRVEARRVAQGLLGLGVAKGESVAIMLPNGREAILALFGALYGGFRATMINLVAGDEAIGYALGHSGAKMALVGEAQADQFDAVQPDGMTRHAVSMLDGSKRDLPGITAADDALLMYTSGTTGRPKGVVHSHASLLAGGWTPALAHKLTPKDRGLCVLPIYHINGLCVTVMGTLIAGGSLVVAEKFSARRFWADVDSFGVTWFSMVPTIISHLLHGEADPSDVAKTALRFGRSASAPLSPEVQRAFESRFDVPIVETMGLTETAAQILSNPLPPGLRKIGSPGVAVGNRAGVLGRDGHMAAVDEEGEIIIHGPNVMQRYLDNPEATQETFTPDGWLLTGDLGRMDADGYIFVTGRKKELIIKGGENIAPREIDEALYAEPRVVEAAAFAVPCPTYGERVEAAVTVSEGSEICEQDLLATCLARLGTFKSPDRIYILEDLPKGPSGKIQRRLLAEKYAS